LLPSYGPVLQNSGPTSLGPFITTKPPINLFELFQEKGAAYFIAEQEGHILGGGGIFPSPGLPAGICELVKMYLLPEARAKGTGALLLNKCMSTAKEMGFDAMYIETLPELKIAISVYEKFGFNYLDNAFGRYRTFWLFSMDAEIPLIRHAASLHRPD